MQRCAALAVSTFDVGVPTCQQRACQRMAIERAQMKRAPFAVIAGFCVTTQLHQVLNTPPVPVPTGHMQGRMPIEHMGSFTLQHRSLTSVHSISFWPVRAASNNTPEGTRVSMLALLGELPALTASGLACGDWYGTYSTSCTFTHLARASDISPIGMSHPYRHARKPFHPERDLRHK